MKKLEWGETPFTSMDRETLERHAQRLYSALSSARSAIHQMRFGNEKSPYFVGNGAGAQAFAKAEYAMDAAQGDDDPESIYRSFFRYANDLLFPDITSGSWTRWRVCPVCGQMASSPQEHEVLSKPCGEIFPHNRPGQEQCPGIMRALEWDDLKPKAYRPS